MILVCYDLDIGLGISFDSITSKALEKLFGDPWQPSDQATAWIVTPRATQLAATRSPIIDQNKLVSIVSH